MVLARGLQPKLSHVTTLRGNDDASLRQRDREEERRGERPPWPSHGSRADRADNERHSIREGNCDARGPEQVMGKREIPQGNHKLE